jgi:hypothetical protein
VVEALVLFLHDKWFECRVKVNTTGSNFVIRKHTTGKCLFSALQHYKMSDHEVKKKICKRATQSIYTVRHILGILCCTTCICCTTKIGLILFWCHAVRDLANMLDRVNTPLSFTVSTPHEMAAYELWSAQKVFLSSSSFFQVFILKFFFSGFYPQVLFSGPNS